MPLNVAETTDYGGIALEKIRPKTDANRLPTTKR